MLRIEPPKDYLSKYGISPTLTPNLYKRIQQSFLSQSVIKSNLEYFNKVGIKLPEYLEVVELAFIGPKDLILMREHIGILSECGIDFLYNIEISIQLLKLSDNKTALYRRLNLCKELGIAYHLVGKLYHLVATVDLPIDEMSFVLKLIKRISPFYDLRLYSLVIHNYKRKNHFMPLIEILVNKRFYYDEISSVYNSIINGSLNIKSKELDLIVRKLNVLHKHLDKNFRKNLLICICKQIESGNLKPRKIDLVFSLFELYAKSLKEEYAYNILIKLISNANRLVSINHYGKHQSPKSFFYNSLVLVGLDPIKDISQFKALFRVYNKQISSVSESFILLAALGLNYNLHENAFNQIIKKNKNFIVLKNELLILIDKGFSGHDAFLLKNYLRGKSSIKSVLSAHGLLKIFDAREKFYLDLVYALSEGMVESQSMTVFYKLLDDIAIPKWHVIRRQEMPSQKVIVEWYTILNLFTKLKFTYKDNLKVFNVNLLAHTEILAGAITTLGKSGYIAKDYPNVYSILVKLICVYNKPEYVIECYLKLLIDYSNSLGSVRDLMKSRLEHNRTIQYLINQFDEDFIENGPLATNNSTIRLFELLKYLACLEKTPLKKLVITYSQAIGYTLHLPNSREVNLSILLRHANLSHLNLSEAEICNLMDIVQALLPEILEGYQLPDNLIIKKLPKQQQIAIDIYTSELYKNINRIFRGEWAEFEDDYDIMSQLEPVDPEAIHSFLYKDERPKRVQKNFSSEVLARFILGCVINDAANKVVSIYSDLPERKIIKRIKEFYKQDIAIYFKSEEEYLGLIKLAEESCVISSAEYQLLAKISRKRYLLLPGAFVLDRGERLDDEVRKRRLSNVYTLPSVTSYSTSIQGSKFFQRPDTTRTKVFGNFKHLPIINLHENEVLISQGVQVKTYQNINGHLTAAFFNSPTYEKDDEYWPEMALYHAYTHYLSKPYKDSHSFKVIKDAYIVRPNHGLAHTYRVMRNINEVINYFGIHALDNNFRLFCRQIPREELELLKIAAVFSITGRESEISAREDLALYESYRISSTQHFVEFIKMNFSISVHPHMLDRYRMIVRYMGNPQFEDKINLNPRKQERLARKYLFRILTVAHKLDLLRCYEPDAFQRSMQACIDWSKKSFLQQQDYIAMVKYNLNLLKAHGNMLYTNIDSGDRYVKSSEDYKPIFAEASTSLLRLFEISELVSRPPKKLNLYQSIFNNHVPLFKGTLDNSKKRKSYENRPYR